MPENVADFVRRFEPRRRYECGPLLPRRESSIILLTGGTGAFGPRVVEALAALGHPLRILVRHQPAAGLLATDVDVCLGDVADPAAVARAVDGADAVVHLASLLHIVSPSPELRGEYERVNVTGTACVVDASRQAGVSRLVFVSSIVVYGCGSPDRVLTEDTEPLPNTIYGEMKLAAERIVLAARRPDGEPLGVVLRLGAVYGGRVKGNYRRLAISLARRRFVPIGPGLNRRTLVYDRDAARAVILALSHPGAPGRVFNVSDGQCHPMKAIITAICASLGRTPPVWSLPSAPVRFAAGLIEDAFLLSGRRPPIARATVDKYCEDMAVNSDRIQQELGFVPHYDLMSGWRETVDYLRREGAL